MGPALRVVSIKQMTVKDLADISKEIKDIILDHEEDYEHDDQLECDDFVIATVRFYAHADDLLVYHCFPLGGNDPAGLLCTLEGKRIITELYKSLVQPWKKCQQSLRAWRKCLFGGTMMVMVLIDL